MKKKYLKTVEDVLALKDTDTKIYCEGFSDYYKFVNGTFCRFRDDGFWQICSSIDSTCNHYIREEEPEEPMQEATEKDLDKLCWCWEDDEENKDIGVFDEYDEADTECKYHLIGLGHYKHCRRLSPEEVAELTGYGVTEDGSRFYGEPFKIVGKEK